MRIGEFMKDDSHVDWLEDASDSPDGLVGVRKGKKGS
jgi:hypothetical protein